MDDKNEQLARVARWIEPEGRLVRSWALTGGVSAQVTALEIMRVDGQVRKVVVRRHGENDLKHNPHIATDEFRLLKQMHRLGLPVPDAYSYDESGEIFSRPYVVIGFIEGQTDFAPTDVDGYVVQLATQLARLHRLDVTTMDVGFLPHQEQRYAERSKQRPAIMDETLDEGRIRETLRASLPLQQRNSSVLLHGDYWPGNMLWRDGQLVGIIDWEDAAVGDPLADVANARFEILWAVGVEAMERFTEQYRELMTLDYANLPYWELYAAVKPISKISEWAADAKAEQQMRERHRWFTDQALGRLNHS